MGLEEKVKVVNKKADEVKYIQKQLYHVHDHPDLSDSMVGCIFKDFVNNTWYPRYGETVRQAFETDEAETERDNVESLNQNNKY